METNVGLDPSGAARVDEDVGVLAGEEESVGVEREPARRRKRNKGVSVNHSSPRSPVPAVRKARQREKRLTSTSHTPSWASHLPSTSRSKPRP